MLPPTSLAKIEADLWSAHLLADGEHLQRDANGKWILTDAQRQFLVAQGRKLVAEMRRKALLEQQFLPRLRAAEEKRQRKNQKRLKDASRG